MKWYRECWHVIIPKQNESKVPNQTWNRMKVWSLFLILDVVCIEHLLSNEMIESVMTYYNSKTIKDNESKTPKQAWNRLKLKT